jgi:DNA-binding PadR family transcriptional regulator
MLCHVILGLLRDGRQRHGYDLILDYRMRTGTPPSAGNFYRELARLAAGKRIEAAANPPEADPRRLPYQITERGRREFDHWLEVAPMQGDEFANWMLFLDHATDAVREHQFDRREGALRVRSEALSRALEDELACPTQMDGTFQSLGPMLERQLKLVTAELEFLENFRQTYAAMLAQRSPEGCAPQVPERPAAHYTVLRKA